MTTGAHFYLPVWSQRNGPTAVGARVYLYKAGTSSLTADVGGVQSGTVISDTPYSDPDCTVATSIPLLTNERGIAECWFITGPTAVDIPGPIDVGVDSNNGQSYPVINAFTKTVEVHDNPLVVHENPPTIFVSPDGDDDFDGRWDRPKLTIYTAMRLATDGDVILRGGTHTLAATDSIDTEVDASGLKVSGAGMDKTVIKTAGAFEAFKFVGNGSHTHARMAFRDFTIDGRSNGVDRSTTAGFSVKYGVEMRLEKIGIHHCNGPGWNSVTSGSHNGVEFDQCDIRLNADSGIKANGGAGSNNFIVRGGYLSENDTYGFESDSGSHRLFGTWIPSNYIMGAKVTGNAVSMIECLVEANYRSFGVRANSHAYLVGDRVTSTDTATNPSVYMCTIAGTSAGSEPTFVVTAPYIGQTVTDGGVTWKNVGLIAEAYGNGQGAGIDDLGSNRLFVVNPDQVYAGPMLLGNTIFQFMRSDNGGVLETRFGQGSGSPPHQRSGGKTYGALSSGLGRWTWQAVDSDTANVDITLLPQGTGGVQIGSTTGGRLRSGTGSPEAAVTGSKGDIFMRTDGGANTSVYIKESGTATNTGWVAK